MDRLTPERRSKLMGRVKGKNTTPERIVRRLLHSLGYRYRLHVTGLAGKPDLAFPSRRVVIFVHGCFWHGHACRYGRLPRSNVVFWADKIRRNRERDARCARSLKAAGWRVMVVWQCQLRDLPAITRKMIKRLGVVATRRSTS
jgi:DNA mismatch endonuclease (patch repair protein)